MRKKAFTLAEVLVTLAVIGVVAALSIPSLMHNKMISECRAGVHTAHSIVTQAVMTMKAEEGGNFVAIYLGHTWTFKPEFINYFKVVKDCGWHDCVPSINPSTVYKTYSKTRGIHLNIMDDGQFMLNNGMTVFIENNVATTGILISVDVNGYQKGPNVWGQDLFTFEIMANDSVKPAGAEGTGMLGGFGTGFANEQATYCDSASTNAYNGVGCTARALTDPDYWDNLPE